MKQPQETHDWYADNLSLAEMARVTGKSKFLIKKMKLAKKFTPPALRKLMAAHPITSDGQAGAPEKSAEPEAPSVATKATEPEVISVPAIAKLLIVISYNDGNCDQCTAFLHAMNAVEPTMNETAEVVLFQSKGGTRAPVCPAISKKFPRLELSGASTICPPDEPNASQQKFYDIAAVIEATKAAHGFGAWVFVNVDDPPPLHLGWIERVRKEYALAVHDGGHTVKLTPGGAAVYPMNLPSVEPVVSTRTGMPKPATRTVNLSVVPIGTVLAPPPVRALTVLPTSAASVVAVPLPVAKAPVTSSPVVTVTVMPQASVPASNGSAVYGPPPSLPTKLCVLMASNRGMVGDVLESLWRNLRFSGEHLGPKNTDVMTEGNYDVFDNRDTLVQRFLDSGAEWSLWLDDDHIFPCGDAAWFKRVTGAKWPDMYCGVPTINRLLAVAKITGKKIVGACYFDRAGLGTPSFSAGRDDAMLRNSLRNVGPRDQQIVTPWTGSGCLLVHRQVYLDIIRTHPQDAVTDRATKPWIHFAHHFFSKINDSGDDVSFCMRARAAGHEIIVDLATMCYHVGKRAYANKPQPITTP